jgi:hypothetical protein
MQCLHCGRPPCSVRFHNIHACILYCVSVFFFKTMYSVSHHTPIYFILLFTNITHHPLPTTHYPLPTTHSLPTTHYPLPTTHYQHYTLHTFHTSPFIALLGCIGTILGQRWGPFMFFLFTVPVTFVAHRFWEVCLCVSCSVEYIYVCVSWSACERVSVRVAFVVHRLWAISAVECMSINTCILHHLHLHLHTNTHTLSHSDGGRRAAEQHAGFSPQPHSHRRMPCVDECRLLQA